MEILPWTLLLASVCCFGGVLGQYSNSEYDSPLPTRPLIPGALPVGGVRLGVPRSSGARRVPAQQLPLEEPRQFRRPPPLSGGRPPRIQAQPPQPTSQQLFREESPSTPLPPRPVVEDLEELLHLDDNSPTTPQPSPQPQPQEPQPSFRPAIIRPQEDFPVPTRQQFRNSVADAEPVQVSRRPVAPELPQPILIQRSKPIEQQIPQRAVRPHQEQQQPRFRPAPRPALQEAKPQQPQRAQPHFNRQHQQQVERDEEYERENPKRLRKPVSQVLKKYRDDNPDGSITWGFENDDGTFKEETIGVDCITRGKYGYIDPDGVRREFSYSSGLPCDKDKDAQEQQADKGYIDYTNNKYVLPNGDSVELTSMAKNKARKSGYKN